MMDQFDFPNEEELLACVSLTVGLSILVARPQFNPLGDPHRAHEILNQKKGDYNGNACRGFRHRVDPDFFQGEFDELYARMVTVVKG